MKNLVVLVLAFLLCLSGGTSVHASERFRSRNPQAVDYLADRIDEYDNILYVYKDFADGANNYTQKAWVGDSYRNMPQMCEDAAGQKGSSGIAAGLDLTKHTWGGYMFVNGVLKAGETIPEPDFGASNAGLDLSGASRLIFYARGEKGGECVEFFMGGLGYDGLKTAPYADSTQKISLGFVTLSKNWKRYVILLDGADLSRVGCGFGWVADIWHNRATNVNFYLDNIHYEFSDSRPQPMFLASYAPVPPGSNDAIINNFAYLYDNCAAAMALSYAGEHESARQIADAIVYAQNNDRYYNDGRLRNAYANGNPKSYPGWYGACGKEFARLPGFYSLESKTWYEDYYAVSTSTGNLAWAMLALCEVYENAKERIEYLHAARQIGDLVLTLQDDKGGFTGGYEGWEGSQTKAMYKSTEHNIDLVAAFGRLHKQTKDKKYLAAADYAKLFVLAMYDKEKGCFYTGTSSDGVTVNNDVIPLDCQTWALLALGHEFSNISKVLRFVEKNMAIDGGYDFNTDKDGVWYEGTAQAALLYRLVGNKAKSSEVMAYLNTNSLPDGSITAADRDGVSTGFIVSGTELPWKYNKRVHLGATAWLAFAQMGRNPFEY